MIEMKSLDCEIKSHRQMLHYWYVDKKQMMKPEKNIYSLMDLYPALFLG